MSPFPRLLSCHTTYTLFPDVAIVCNIEGPASILRLIVGPNVSPTLVYSMFYKSQSFLELSSSHTTYTLFPDVATTGLAENPPLLLRLMVAPKLVPPSVDFLNKIFKVSWSIIKPYYIYIISGCCYSWVK